MQSSFCNRRLLLGSAAMSLLFATSGCRQESPTPPEEAAVTGKPTTEDSSTQAIDRSGEPLSTEPDEEGWRPLFDGTSFAGWRGLGRESLPEGHWIIEGSAIRKVASGDVPTGGQFPARSS